MKNRKSANSFRILLVTAHPDDECMFFTPTIVNLIKSGHQIDLICLSTGNSEGLGPSRKAELLRAARVLKLNSVQIVDDESLEDGMHNDWPEKVIVKYVEKKLANCNYQFILTFDGWGVSGHANHQSISRAVNSLNSTIDVMNLVSVPIWLKYLGPLGVWISSLIYCNRKTKHQISYWEAWQAGFQAMLYHRSQLFLLVYFQLQLISLAKVGPNSEDDSEETLRLSDLQMLDEEGDGIDGEIYGWDADEHWLDVEPDRLHTTTPVPTESPASRIPTEVIANICEYDGEVFKVFLYSICKASITGSGIRGNISVFLNRRIPNIQMARELCAELIAIYESGSADTDQLLVSWLMRRLFESFRSRNQVQFLLYLKVMRGSRFSAKVLGKQKVPALLMNSIRLKWLRPVIEIIRDLVLSEKAVESALSKAAHHRHFKSFAALEAAIETKFTEPSKSALLLRLTEFRQILNAPVINRCRVASGDLIEVNEDASEDEMDRQFADTKEEVQGQTPSNSHFFDA